MKIHNREENEKMKVENIMHHWGVSKNTARKLLPYRNVIPFHGIHWTMIN